MAELEFDNPMADGPQDDGDRYFKAMTEAKFLGRPVSDHYALSMSREWGKVMGALLKAQSKMDGGPKRTSDNPFYHSKYADMAEITSFIRPHLLSEGLVLTGGVGTTKRGDETTVSVTRMLCHPASEQWVKSTMTFHMQPYTNNKGETVQVSAQDCGKAATYGMRYLTMALIDLAPQSEEDDDAQSISHRGRSDPRRSAPPRKPSAPKKASQGPAEGGLDAPRAAVGHPGMKGQPITEIVADDLVWLLKFLGKGAADNENQWQDKNRADVVKIAQYISEHEDDCDVTKEVADLVARVLKKWGE